jgi:leucyl/phenylalanyl-tRNA--protein transferase
MHILTNVIAFPPVDQANEHGMLAIGGDLSVVRLQLAYRSGIFPWFSEGEPIVWYSPKERMVLFPEELKLSKSMRQVLRKKEFKITVNQAFKEVIFNCKSIKRNDAYGTWITDTMEKAYIELHKLGIAKSVEVWQLDTDKGELSGVEATSYEDVTSTPLNHHTNYKLVGGLYGVEVEGVFCGESMFSKVSNASKIALIHLTQNMQYSLIDCQIYNDHLASLGAKEISREEFSKFL